MIPRLLALIAAVGLSRSIGAEPSAEAVDFFESKVRPLFADQCYGCHSAKAEKLKGALRLDTPEGILKGGSSGPAIIPGDPEASLLIKAVRYTDPDLQMPPKNKKLAKEQIATLEAWVKMGAPLPLETRAKQSAGDMAEVRKRHWAFQLVHKPSVPSVSNKRWVQTPVDNFVLAALEKRHLTPAPAADRRTLIRRMSYDLIGLPPTPEEVEAFIEDKKPDATGRLVERLLASPHYGERWGRYWLDVARFADTKGYLAGGEERRYAFSYTYRDYVVQAFNEDKPYNQFLLEQIAGDSLKDQRALAALGFLTLGRRFLNNQNDIIDDRIDVVTRGTLGLTVACARCHDHKFDPIPTRDYYALHGVFASSEEPAELPLLGPLQDSAQYQDYLKQKAKIETEITEYKAREVAKFLEDLRQHVGDYLLGATEASKLADSAKLDTFAGERKLDPEVLRRWMAELEQRRKKPDPIFDPWFAFAKLTDTEFSSRAKAWLDALNDHAQTQLGSGSAPNAQSPPAVNPLVAKALSGNGTESLKAGAESYNKLFRQIEADWKTALTAASNQPPSTPLPNPDQEALRQVLYAEGSAVNVPRSEAENILARKLADGIAPIRNRIEALSWTHPGAPPRAMALVDRPNPANSHVLKRGNPANPGEEVPRRFLEVLSPSGAQPFTNGSGRLDLAQAIASPQNPLTARVFVNRVWLHHFGEGLVATPGDFGVRTEEPVQRALLDYMAATFVENGWSTKQLHRLILLSATYRQSSDPLPETIKADPDNRLFSSMNRQRLDFEALRDTLLALAGKLDLTMGGLPVDLQSEPFSTRRTIYGLIDRQNLPAVFRTFDFANPDTSNQRRFHTTVPQQALFLMNSPFVIQQARSLAHRPPLGACKTDREKIRELYRLIYQRTPTREEVQLGERFLAAQPQGPTGLPPLERYAQVLLLSNETTFVD